MNIELNSSKLVDKFKTLADFQKNNVLCDGYLVFDDKSVISIHKAVLALKSPYFRAQFTTLLHSDDQKHFTLPGIKKEQMIQIINYCYDENMCITEDNVYDLLKLANYFNVQGLEDICVRYLTDNLSPKNCINCLNFAESFFSFELFQNVEYYLYKYFEKIIVESHDLLKLNIKDLCKILKSDRLNVKSEEIVWEFVVRWIDQNPDERKKYIQVLIVAPRLGLINTDYFMEKVKTHPYVTNVPEIRNIIIRTVQFLYDLDVNKRERECLLPVELTTPRLPYEILIVLGGWSGGSPINLIEAYDTRADRWTKINEVDNMGPRAYHGLIAIENTIYVIGGFDGIEYFNTCRKFNAITNEWSSISPMHIKRCYVSVTVLNDHIYAMGGYDGNSRQNTAEKYDPKTNQWVMIASMNSQRSDADACTLNGKIYITGGFNGQECLNTAEYYDPEKNRWTLIEPMRCRRSGVSCIGFDNKLYVLGGFNGVTRMNSCEVYDPIPKTWTPIHDMYSTRSNFAVEIIDDLIFAIGGFNGVTTIFHVECYDKKVGKWYEATDLHFYRSALAACVLRDLPSKSIEHYMYKNRETIAIEHKLKSIKNVSVASSSSENRDENNNENPNQIDEIDVDDFDLDHMTDIHDNFDDNFQNVLFHINNLEFDDGFDADIDDP